MEMNKPFTIESFKSHEFRVGKITPIELLALQMQINFNNLELTTNLFTFILEHLEVKIMDSWVAVKERNKEVYMPMNIATNLAALRELVFYFLNNYMKPLFTNSNE